MEKDKLLDYMFDQNSKLTDQLTGVREDLRLQREQADRHHRDLKASLDRMEERAVAAERRAGANVSVIYHTLFSTCKQMKASGSEYFGKLFDKVVRGCTDMVSMLPMNISLSVNKY